MQEQPRQGGMNCRRGEKNALGMWESREKMCFRGLRAWLGRRECVGGPG